MTRKPFKFEIWMLGIVIVPIGVGIAIWNYSQRASVELGGDCTDREQCKEPATQCMKLGEKLDFKQVCTVSCSTQCPSGFECVRMDVRYGGSFTGATVGGDEYCLAPSLAKRVSAAR